MMQDSQYMRRAIALAYQGAGRVAPNPMVGAVLVHEGRILAEGWHAVYGEVHAEVACLQRVSSADRALIPESTMYVTLEPCAHQGKQPPCAHRLVQERIRRVVIAAEDPFPEVAGRGIDILRNAGIEVRTGCCRDEARRMCRRFLQVQEGGRPYIILKWAQSAEGNFAPADGSRCQLSNAFSQTLVHRWRTEEDAIMVGFRTALADDPQLTARAWRGRSPLRIVLDRSLQLPASHKLMDGKVPTWIINEQETGEGDPRLVRLPFDERLLPELFSRLKDAGVISLFVEGGRKLLDSFIEAGYWDEARVFTTPALGAAGIPAPGLSQARPAFSTAVGNDFLTVYQHAESRFPYVPGAIL